MIRIAQAVLAALSAVASFGNMPNQHPHTIRDARDAIATASAIWKAQFPQSGVENENWQKESTAKLTGSVWTVRQIMATPDDPRGTVILLDSKDGHIISAKIIN